MHYNFRTEEAPLDSQDGRMLEPQPCQVGAKLCQQCKEDEVHLNFCTGLGLLLVRTITAPLQSGDLSFFGDWVIRARRSRPRWLLQLLLDHFDFSVLSNPA